MGESHDKHILSKLQDLNRNSQIRLPNGEVIRYWQTLQYANRHFGIFATRWRNEIDLKNPYEALPEHEKIQVWGMNGLLRKILCHPDFLTWTTDSYFEDGADSASVYKQFEDAHKGAYIGKRHLKKKAVVAVANGKGIVFNTNNKKGLAERKFGKLMATYAHEFSHLLGYSHQSKVPYPIMKFVQASVDKKLYDYKVYDLIDTPDFEVVEADRL